MAAESAPAAAESPANLSIIEQVDGPGSDGKIGAEADSDHVEDGDTKAEDVEAQAPDAEVEDSSTLPSMAELEKLLTDSPEEDSGDDPVEVLDDGTDEEPESEGGSRFERRVRSLNARVKEEQQARSQLTAQMQQFQQQAYQANQYFQQQMQEAQVERAKMQAQLETYQRMSPQQEEDPADVFKQKILGEAKESLNPEISALRKELDAMRASQEQARRRAESQRAQQRYQQEADLAVQDIMGKELAGADEAFLQEAGMWALAAARAGRTDVKSSTQALHSWARKAALHMLRNLQQTKGAKVAASQKVKAPVATGGKSGAKGNPLPADITKSGAQDHLDYMFQNNGFPGFEGL